jgi:type I restriction enzyme S subunit
MSRANTRELLGSVAIVPAGTRARLILCDKLYRLRLQRRVEPRFLVWALGSVGLRRQMEAEATGASQSMQNIGQDTVKRLRVPFPTLGGQRAIANFLDAKTVAIDDLIAKKQLLIELIQEKRQALITQAVTKGLDPNVPMKDSRIPWLGQIPAHWELSPMRHVARLESGHTPSRSCPEWWIPEECIIPWVSLADVGALRSGDEEFIHETAECISELGMANSAARLLPAQTVVLSRTASVGFSAIITKPMATTQDFVNWVCGPRIAPEFLLYVFRAMTQEFERLRFGSVHSTIYMPDVRRFSTPVPPGVEQARIVADVRNQLARLRALRSLTEQQIDKLKEYRQALISAAVTGKLDVPAPEEAIA